MRFSKQLLCYDQVAEVHVCLAAENHDLWVLAQLIVRGSQNTF